MGLSSVKIAPVNRQRHHGANSMPIRCVVDSATLSLARAAPTATKAQFVGAAINWSLCLLLIFLLLSQFLAIVLSSSTTGRRVSYGRNPVLGVYTISGFNDEPYSDRMLVCRRRGRRFEIDTINEALGDPTTVVEDTDGTRINGYRVVKRVA